MRKIQALHRIDAHVFYDCPWSAGADLGRNCRALALRNNKQVNVARLSKDMAYYTRKSARTKYLPKVDVLGGYEYTSREINLLSESQKNSLRNMGTNGMSQMGEGLSSNLTNMLGGLVQQGQGSHRSKHSRWEAFCSRLAAQFHRRSLLLATASDSRSSMLFIRIRTTSLPAPLL